VRKIVLIFLAAVLFILVPRAARTGAAFPAPIIVPEGGSVTIPAPAVVRADTSAPDVAQAVPGSDEVTVRGIKPVLWTGRDGHLWASSAVVTPLQEQLGLPKAPGVELNWDNHWEFQASSAYGLIGYRIPFGVGSLMLGGSTLGAAGEVEAFAGPVSFSAVALMTPAGQMLSGAQTSLNVGPVTVGYETGPAGGSPTVAFHSGSVTVSAAVPPEGGQVGVGLSLGGGAAVTGTWLPQGGWRAGLTLPLDGVAPAAGSGSSASGGVSAACGGPQHMDLAVSGPR